MRRSRLRGTDVRMKSTMSCAPAGGCRCRSTGRTGRRHAALAVAAAAEVDVAQHVLDVARPRLGEALDLLRGRVEAVALVDQRDQHRVAFDVGLVGLRAVQVEHDARAVAGLDDVEAAERGVVDLALRRAEVVGRVEEVERDARRARDREPAGGFCGGFLSWNRTIVRPEVPFDTVTWSMLLACDQADCANASAAIAASPVRAALARVAKCALICLPPRGSGCWSCSEELRSVQSPALSCTSSLSLISVSLMPVTTPKFCPMKFPDRTW
jgi:hypothetical protein